MSVSIIIFSYCEYCMLYMSVTVTMWVCLRILLTLAASVLWVLPALKKIIFLFSFF